MSDDTRTSIINAAGPIFADKGFQDTTVREICKAACVNLASVNYYFGDKQQLYVETINSAVQRRFELVTMPTWPEGTPGETKLRDFVTTTIRRMLGGPQAPWHMRLMMREMLRPTGACEELVRECFRPDFEVLLRILREILPADTPLHQIRQMGFSVIGQCLYYRVAGRVVSLLVPEQEYHDHYAPDQLAEHISRFCLAGMGLAAPIGDALPTGQET